MSDQFLRNQWRRIGNGLDFREDLIHARPHCYWHRVGLADTAGASPGKLNIFGAGLTQGITNLDNAGRLPAGNYFRIYKFGIKIEQGFDISDNAESTQANYAEGATLPTDSPGEVSEAIRKLYNHGIVDFKIRNRRVIDSIYGVENFPWGSEARHLVAHTMDDATLAVASQFSQVGVGPGDSGDGWWFDPGQALFPDFNFSATIDWSDIALDTYADLVVKVGLFGMLATSTTF